MFNPSGHSFSSSSSSNLRLPNVLVVGVGEYVTGYVHTSASKSDKPIGVVLLTLFDMKRRGKVNEIYIAGTQGTKYPQIRQHLTKGLSRYNFVKCEKMQKGTDEISIDEYLNGTFPDDHIEKDIYAYREGLKKLNKGDVVFIFTPDHTHHQIALEAVKAGMHVLVAKPLVQKLEHHYELIEAIRDNEKTENGSRRVMVGVEVHKRWDPIYSDARDRILNPEEIGDFSYFTSYMSQPSSQLITFKNWAAYSDISYYLNSHHIDFHCWSLGGMETRLENQRFWRPYRVFASGSYGIANSEPFNIETEDSITLTVQWRDFSSIVNKKETNLDKCLKGTAIYTSSWVAPKKSDVHSQQRFMYQGSKGEITIDQAHRGYTLASDCSGSMGLRSINPLFMKYSPDVLGRFSGQNGYGYLSLASFMEAAFMWENGIVSDFDILKEQLATVDFVQGKTPSLTATLLTTAILDAGRKSLNKQLENSTQGDVIIHYDLETLLPTRLE